MSPSVLIRTRAVSDVEVAGSRVRIEVYLICVYLTFDGVLYARLISCFLYVQAARVFKPGSHI